VKEDNHKISVGLLPKRKCVVIYVRNKRVDSAVKQSIKMERIVSQEISFTTAA